MDLRPLKNPLATTSVPTSDVLELVALCDPLLCDARLFTPVHIRSRRLPPNADRPVPGFINLARDPGRESSRVRVETAGIEYPISFRGFVFFRRQLCRPSLVTIERVPL